LEGPARHREPRFFRISSRKHCAAVSRVVINLVPRVRANRTESLDWSGAASARRLLMPARETEAIILKTFPLGEADRLVSFLGRSSGRVRGVASGARRLKNRYGSTLEVLSHVQLWYVEKETRDLVRIQQAELLESFHKAQSDYGLSTGLAVISEVSELVLPEHEVSEPMFRLILMAVREIERTGDWALPLSYFAFWTVRLGGWLPRFDRCAACDSPFGVQPAFYGAQQSGVFCGKCRRPGMQVLHNEARVLAERFTSERLDRIAPDPTLQGSAKELREASLAWIEFHIERRLPTRELLETA
jgi:DNA repair protein RecO (recombination protein O)